MITEKTARTIFLSFPEAIELEHAGHPDFRINNKIFGSLRPDEEVAAVILPLDDQEAWLAARPEAVVPNGWSRYGCVDVRLKHISRADFRKLATLSWRLKAPKKLAAAHPKLK